MPKNYTDEFKRDVVAVAKEGAATQRQIAKDFGISKSALSTWMRAAELQERGLVGPPTGAGAAGVAGDAVALREALKRIRLLEQEAEVMRRAVAYLSQAQLPK
ncbi:transposase [Leifsonia psychrotolerans]|uniref:Transposase n=1 Tax=Glaciibacter psychrotolerans TaxID=670054 RepID=A0A7Z0ECR7_9MICO|nr:transposase [Leifsonia psychrotolerans]